MISDRAGLKVSHQLVLAFEEMAKQTGVRFIYSEGLLKAVCGSVHYDGESHRRLADCLAKEIVGGDVKPGDREGG